MKLALELLQNEIVRLERSLRLTHENFKQEVQVKLDSAKESQSQMIKLSKIV